MYQEAYSDLVTIEEICDILAIGKNTAYRLLKNQEIAAFRIGRVWKVPRESVTNYILDKSKLK
jgi:excisionase family DNA binding protein